MRRYLIISAAVLAAACSSNPTTGAPSGGGTASIVTLVQGDGQIGAAGKALPVALSVVVKDASGAAVPSVAVHFAIDSGGGSLSAASETTGSDGVAGGVTWTLGSSGTNVVAVTVGSLAAVRFHATATGGSARTVITAQPVSANGGTVSYSHAGDALNGLTVTVPAAAYTSGSTWTITADSTIAVPLPTGFSLAGPPLVIGNGQGYADSVMTLTMPLHLGSDVAAAPFYYDPTTKLLEPIALVDRTDSSATLATRHFSVDLLALPGANGVASAERAQLRSGFGNVVVVWVQTPLSQLVGTYTSGFSPGTDDWEFANYGDYISPDGDCEGMSITAMYYWYTFRRGGSASPGLYHRYDVSLANQLDNVQGIRYAGSVQGDYDLGFSLGFDQAQRLNQQAVANGANLQLLTSSWIALTIKLTHQPVLLGLNSAHHGHAVVAYAATVTPGALTTVSVSDPNQPGNRGVTINFVNGLFTPTNFEVNASAAAESYNQVYAVGVSGEIPILAVSLRWLQFTSKSAGADRYPSGYSLEVQNRFSGMWHTVTSHKLLVYDSVVVFRTNCPNCTSGPTHLSNPAIAWNAQGSGAVSLSGGVALPIPASFPMMLEELGFNGTANDAGYIDYDSVNVVWQQPTINGPGPTVPDSQITYTVLTPPAESGVHYTYSWDFGDHGGVEVVSDTITRKHTFTTSGNYTITLTISLKATGETIAVTTFQQRISADIIWAFSQVTQTATTLPPGGIGIDRSDTLAQGFIQGFFAGLQSDPTNSLIYAAGGPANCHVIVFEQFAAGTNPVTDSLVDGQQGGIWGSDCNLQPELTSTLTLGPLGHGVVVGSAGQSPELPDNEALILHGGTINATMNGPILTGSVTWLVQYSTGLATYTMTFRAVQEVP